MTPSSRLAGSGLWTRLAACVALACGPLAVALLTEGGWLGEEARVVFLLAFGLALAIGAVLMLRAGDARAARDAAAPERALRQARDQQAATAEILGAMAAAPPDLQRVLDTIARNAARVCDALYAVVFHSDGTQIRLAAHHGLSPSRLAALNERYPMSVNDEGLVAHAIRTASMAHFPDLLSDPKAPTWLRDLARTEGFRSLVVVPMVQDGRAIGCLNVSRPEGGFSERQIQLLQTFAAQAVIALENTRLFQELQARNRELTESLEQQTATAEILRVISGSPTDIQPVFNSILDSAVRLCEAAAGALYRLEDRVVHIAALVHGDEAVHAAFRAAYPRPVEALDRAGRRAFTEGRTAPVADIETDPDLTEETRARTGATQVRSMVVVPMLQNGQVIGSITVGRAGPDRAPRPFSSREIDLLETFAAQAVIAIENTRLFTELQTRNRELTESLEQQTATGEILRVISSSPTDIQPVFDEIARSAARLCEAFDAIVLRVDGEILRLVAHHGPMPAGDVPLHRGTVGGRTVMERRVIHLDDIQAEADEFPEGSALAKPRGHRTTLSVPLLRENVAIGNIQIRRNEVRPFSDTHVRLLQTFADQAVIAIENVRLFQELQARNRALTEALEQQTATAEILRIISSSPTDLRPALEAIAESAARLCESTDAIVFRVDGDELQPAAVHGAIGALPNAIRPGFVSGRAVLERRTIHVEDLAVAVATDFPDAAEHQRRFGHRTTLATPLLREGVPIGAITIRRLEVRPFTVGQVRLLETFATQAVIAIENVRLFQELQTRNRDLTETLEQQTATAEILRVISSSPTDVQPVFDTIVESVVRLCDGPFTTAFRFDGELIHPVAYHRAVGLEGQEFHERMYPRPPSRDSVVARAVLERTVVHVRDVESDPDVPPDTRALAHALGYRSILAVPMLRDGTPIGALGIGRRPLDEKVRPFSDREIDLVKTFAAQAVIAVENVRLFTELESRNRELTESLEQQTATGAILRVISSSPTDIQPVLDAVAESATRLCDARDVSIALVDRDVLRVVASHGPMARWWPEEGIPVGRGSVTGRAVVDRRTIHIHDLVTESDEEFPQGKEYQRQGGHRTNAAIPLLKEGVAIGVIATRRVEVRPFTDRQIRLLETFAAQAVIAIENVRLFQELEARNRELTESLEQQTATGEILRVISSSPTDLVPVMAAVTENAARLARADHALIGEAAEGRIRWLATSGCPLVSEGPSISRQLPSGRAILDCQTTQVEDVTDLTVDFPGVRRAYDDFGVRTILATPLVREGQAIGVLLVRRARVQPFTGKEVELLRTFADQAVIAIENVRLFTELGARNRELTEALEQQTATAEILGVISRSPTALDPVLEAVARNASRLCGAANVSLFSVEGSLMRKVAEEGLPLAALRVGETRPITRTTISGRAMIDRTTIHVTDHQSTEAARAYPDVRRDTGIQTTIGIPLLREGVAIGAFTAYRTEPRPFSEREIALLQTFADQAVIAIENVRLFQELEARNRELTESLEQQTATSEILRAISASPTDTQPVFDSIAQSAVRLCGGRDCFVWRFDGALVDIVAHQGFSSELLHRFRQMYPVPVDADTLSARSIRERAVVHRPDIPNDPDVSEFVRQIARMGGYRTGVVVPMLRSGDPIGAIGVTRGDLSFEPRPFSDKEIALLQTFADQAVIAIENVRLFQELQARNRELTEALEQQTATAEILRVISRSPTNVQPVFDGIVASAVKLCGGLFGSIYLLDGELVNLVGTYNLPAPETERFRQELPARPHRGLVGMRAILDGAVVQAPDVTGDPEFRNRELADAIGMRSIVAVPMLRDGRTIGSLSVGRQTPGLFPASLIGLLQTFADQAVIAIENVRLFTELGARNRELTESLEQQTATSEILRAISSSPTDTQPVFDTIAQRAFRVCNGARCIVLRLDGETIHLVAHHGQSEEWLEESRRVYPYPVSSDTPVGQAIREGNVIHVADVLSHPSASLRRLAQVGGYRTVVVVPMLRGGIAVGAIGVSRSDAAGGPRPFTEKEIALLRTFADQGVIAVENVRLFRELEARNRELTESLEQQTATSEILRAISSSPTDTQPVFDTIAQRAFRVCDGSHCTVFQFDGTLIHLVAHHGQSAGALEEFHRIFPVPPTTDALAARAIRERAVVHNPDLLTDPSEAARRISRAAGFRTGVVVPMLRGGKAVGAIGVGRSGPGGTPRPFTEKEIALLRTFADQGVIAVENVRLFRELEARNRELSESLEQQTATSEILRAISASPTDTQPVFDTIAQRAGRLCDGTFCVVLRFDGALIHLAAHYGVPTAALEVFHRVYPASPAADSLAARSIREGTVAHSPDLLNDQSEAVRGMVRAGGYRTGIAVPMLRGGRAVGAIAVARSDAAGGPRPYTEKEIALLKTFADQGVIAVENVRLFRELEARTRELGRSVEELQALGEVGRAVSSTLDLPTVLSTIVARAVQLSGTSGGVVYEYDGERQEFLLRASHRIEEELVEVLRQRPVRLGEGATGLAALRRVPVEVTDTIDDRELQIGQLARSTLNRLGYRSIVGIPLLLEQEILGALTVFRREPGSFPPETVSLLQSFATQSTIAIQNARLFREIEAKGRELEVASRHKSQFLANMSHELRTPLNAILGYTELMIDGIYGELPPKAGDVMARVDRSGKHLLGLINDVLDLSKIEAGQLELALADYSLTEIVNAVITQVESLAAEKGLILQATVAPGLPAGRGDERRLAQVLLNLVGNAIKFTEVGSVRVVAHLDGDAFVVAVADTGPGIAEADRQRIFEEFQQADSSSTRKKGGTGLGLSIARRIVELHGGRIWVESMVGRGSTFSVQVPVRVERQVMRA